MPEALNPWSNGQAIDTRRLFDDFGIEPIGPLLDLLPEVPAFMRRGIIVGHRDYRPIAEAIRDRRPFHVLTGFMPSGHPHLGHLLVMREVVWHVRQGGHGMITIADREAHAVRGLSWEDCDRYGRGPDRALRAGILRARRTSSPGTAPSRTSPSRPRPGSTSRSSRQSTGSAPRPRSPTR